LLALRLGATVGARRYACATTLRAGSALRGLPGWKRRPGDDAIRNSASKTHPQLCRKNVTPTIITSRHHRHPPSLPPAIIAARH
jgi:hypothetical protein